MVLKLARRVTIQYCAKVMRTNFDEFHALFSSNYRRTFDQYFAAFAQQLNEILATICQGKRKIARLNKKSLLRIFEVAKFRRKFTSNQMKYPPTFQLQDKCPINMNSQGKT